MMPLHAAMTQARAQRAPRQARARRAQVLVSGCIEKTPNNIESILTIRKISGDAISLCHDRRAPRAHLVRRAPGARRFAALLQRRRLLLTIQCISYDAIS